jgi:O-antigen/teichoic acid export membrane protein
LGSSNTIKGSFKWSLLIQLSNQIFGFIITLILARILAPSDFGIIGLISIFINLSKKITDGGLTSSLIRTQIVSNRDFSTVFYFNLFCSTLLYLLLFVSAPFFASFFKVPIIENLIKVSGLTIIISAFTITQSVQLNKNLDFKRQYKILIPSLVLSAASGILSAVYGLGVWSLVIKELVFSIVASIQLWYYSKWMPSWVFDKDCLKLHFRYGYKLALTDLISQLFNDSYKAIIGKFFSASQLGFFTRAQSMQELPNQVVFNTVNRVLFPVLSKVQNDDLKLKKIYGQIIQVVTFIITPFLMLLYIVAKPLFVFLLTAKWLPAVPYFKILIISAMIAPLQPYLLNICKVKGRSDLVLKLSIVEYIFISLSMIAIIPFGIPGLLWGLVAATLAKLFVAMVFAGRLINYSFFEQLASLKDGFTLSLVGYLFIALLTKSRLLPDFTPIIDLIVTTSLFCAALFIFSWLFRPHSLIYIKQLLNKS